LEEAVHESKETSTLFAEETLKEYAIFQKTRVDGFKTAIQQYVTGHATYYKEVRSRLHLCGTT
jgi:hypothetical protein